MCIHKLPGGGLLDIDGQVKRRAKPKRRKPRRP